MMLLPRALLLCVLRILCGKPIPPAVPVLARAKVKRVCQLLSRLFRGRAGVSVSRSPLAPAWQMRLAAVLAIPLCPPADRSAPPRR